MRRSTKILAAAVALLFLGNATYNVTYWRWNDREELFLERAADCGWPADELEVSGGGHESAGLFGVRETRTWIHPDRPGDVYELTLVRKTPFGFLHMERAYFGPKED